MCNPSKNQNCKSYDDSKRLLDKILFTYYHIHGHADLEEENPILINEDFYAQFTLKPSEYRDTNTLLRSNLVTLASKAMFIADVVLTFLEPIAKESWIGA